MNYENNQAAQLAVQAAAKTFDPEFLSRLNNAKPDEVDTLNEEYEDRADVAVGAALFFAQLAQNNAVIFDQDDMDAARSDFDVLLESNV